MPTSACRRSSPPRSPRCSRAGAPRGGAYAVARRNRFLGRWLTHGEGYPDWKVRLFDRRRARWSDDPVHEHVIADAPVGAPRRRSAACVGGIARRLHRQAEPLHDAAGRGAACARRARGRVARRAVAVRALSSLLCAEARLSRRRPGFRAHRDRRVRELSQVREAARARAARPNERNTETSQEAETRGKPMTSPRLCASCEIEPARRAVLVTGAAGFIGMHAARALLDAQARRSPASTTSIRTTTCALKEARVATLADRPGFAFAAPRPRRRGGDGAPVSPTAASRVSSISPRSRACAIRWRIRPRTCATTSTRSATCSKAAATRASRISSTRRRRRCTAPITRCRSPRTSRSIIR